jgi:hypothetical protein
MIGGGGAGGFYGGGGGAGACIVAIGHTIPGGVCNITVGSGSATYAPMWTGNGYTVGSPGGDSSISVDGTTLYLAKGGGAGGAYFRNGNPGGCGGGGGYGSYGTRLGGDVSTNIVKTSNGVINTGPTIQPTYAVFGNKGGDQLDTTLNKSIYTGAGGGGIGAAAPNHALGDLAGGPGGAGLNQATINGITYNFKSYFANNNTFGDISGYIGGGGAGISSNNSTQADGGVGGGGKGAVLSPEGTSRATSGAANTGSGGGSADEYRISGGSGIVIIRYKEDSLIDCVGDWGEWNACDYVGTCDGINASIIGTRSRTYRVTRPVSNGGRTCPIANNTLQTDSTCQKTDCPVDCVGDWGTWSACDYVATCDGINATAPRTGTRTRTYKVTRPVSNGGRTCPIADNTTETDNTCSKTDCPVDCVGNWGEWNACAATCDGINATAPRTGTRTRTYRVTRPVSNRGRTCPIADNTTETDITCSKTDCPVDCSGNWDRWTACTATCDGINAIRTGSRTRTYRVRTYESNGGQTCPTIETDFTCQKTDCPVDCIDENNHCAYWASIGECDKNTNTKFVICKKSCKTCGCRDENNHCAYWTSIGECDKNPGYMKIFCRKSCKICS